MCVRTFQKLVWFKTSYRAYAPYFSTIPQERTFPNTEQLNKQISAIESDSGLSNLKNPKSSSSVILFLKDFGFSNALLEKIVKTVPKVLSSKLEQTIKPKIQIFKNLGLSTAQIANVISADPRILNRVSDHNIERSVLILKKVLGNKFDDPRILKNLGWFLNYDLENTLLPNIKLMKGCGIEECQIMKMFYNYPRFLVQKTENFKEFVRRVDEMGVDRESKVFIYAIRTISSMSFMSWEQKLNVFRGLGYKECHILLTFRRFPCVFAVSERKIKDIAEFLLNSGKYDSSFIFRYPYIFIYSLERRLKPRLRVLEILKREKNLKFKTVANVFSISDARFFATFVRPHLDEVKELSFMVNDATT